MKTYIIIGVLLCISCYNSVKAQTEIDSRNRDLDFKSISETDYTSYLLKETERLTNAKESDSTFFKKRGVTLKSYCDQICETYLTDDITGEKFWLPASFDQGILGTAFSPNHNYFMVFGSYDGPDYNHYYDYRADIHIFKITKNKGLNLLEFYFSFYTKEWSIEDIVWIDNATIALKIYEDGRFGDGEHLKFKYIKTSIK
ncbi:hypothetical protein [Winogradskyella sp. PC D3.3]